MSRPISLGVSRGINMLPSRVLRLKVQGWATSERPQHTSSTGINLSQTTSLLRNLDNGAEVFLVGTAHVSKRSAQEVRDMINVVKPDVVMVELCSGRAARLRRTGQTSDGDFLKDALVSLFAPGANMSQQMFKFGLQGLYRFLRSLGLDPGGEFKVALDVAEEHGARIVYGDREVGETLKRLAASITAQDVFRLLSGAGPQPPQQMVDFFQSGGLQGTTSVLESQVEAMKTRQMAREMAEFLRQINPELAAALIDERDEVMARSLRQLKGRVVGVVGLAHLDGIEKQWEAMQRLQTSTITNRSKNL